MSGTSTDSAIFTAIQKLIGIGAAALLLLVGASINAFGQEASATAAKYTFTTILDSHRARLEPTRCAAINASGVVAVQVRDNTLGINMLITKRAANDEPVIVADTRAIADFPTFCDNGISLIPSDPSINDLEEVAFQGNLRRLTTRADCGTAEQRRRRQGVFLGSGEPLITIAHTINAPGGDFISEFLVADQAANTSGVAFVPELDINFDQGLVVGDKTGSFDTRYLRSEGTFNGTSSRVSINEIGQIAFRDTLQGSFTQGIFLSNPDGTFTTIVDSSSGELDSVGDPSLNIFAVAAFEGSKIIDGQQVLGIFTSSGGAVTTVADNTGPYASFSEPSLNDHGHVVFTANLDEFDKHGRQIQGVFTGPDPKTDKVLQMGDKYESERVTSIFTCSEALNNAGEIVMTVQSEDPETFEVHTIIVRATPAQQ